MTSVNLSIGWYYFTSRGGTDFSTTGHHMECHHIESLSGVSGSKTRGFGVKQAITSAQPPSELLVQKKHVLLD